MWNAFVGECLEINFWALELTIPIRTPFHVTKSEAECRKVTLRQRILMKFDYHLNSHMA
jgi:hypothetical protein